MTAKRNTYTPAENEKEISRIWTDWYQTHKRELPWRETTNPYLIWISEIILQQTRVIQGMSYFLRFTERFPGIQTLAAATEDEVLKYWQGLGYYSRARNLHAAARDIMNRFNGTFPSAYEDIRSLKGIGDYTAAAIISSAWNRPYPVVDGNVYRVLSRLFALEVPIDTNKGKKVFAELAMELLDPTNARLHNQAIMEFGALQCVPQNPDCRQCPLMDRCLAFANNTVQHYPVKQHKTKTRDRYLHYFHIRHKGKTWLHRRSGKDIWAGLYEFPLIETDSDMDFSLLQQTAAFSRLFANCGNLTFSIHRPKEKHILSHQILYATFYRVEIEQESKILNTYLCIAEEEIEQYAVPRLIHVYMENLE